MAKINKLLVQNSTLMSIRTAGRRSEPTAAASELTAAQPPVDSTPVDERFKDSNILKEKSTTTTDVTVVNKKSSSSLSPAPLPEPPPVDAFHIRLCSVFVRASKTTPLLK